MSDDAPTEPRESDSGQEQATDTEDETMAETERESREEHPDTESGATHGWVEPVGPRTTAPMSDFSGRDVGIGLAVFIVGLVVTFAIPLVLTLG